MSTPHWLKNLVVSRVALVDDPANPLAEVALFKRRAVQAATAELAELQRHSAVLMTELEQFRELLAIVKPLTAAPTHHEEEQVDKETEISKALADDVEKGRVVTLKGDIERLAKSRADALWRARGAPKDGKLAALVEAWETPLDEWAGVSADNPTLRKCHEFAPESREVSKSIANLEEERAELQAELDRIVAKTTLAHPDWSRITVLDHVYGHDKDGQRAYKKYGALGNKLQKARSA
jgi:hypothetical protein